MQPREKWDKQTKDTLIWLAYLLTTLLLITLADLFLPRLARTLDRLIIVWSVLIPIYFDATPKPRRLKVRKWLPILAAASLLVIAMGVLVERQ